MSFANQMREFCLKEAPEKTGVIVRQIITEISQRIDIRSPVGDAKYWNSPPPPGYVGGRFRGNWQYSYGSAPVGSLDRIDPNGGAAQAEILQGIMASPVAGIHWIANNLPYAQRIEEGHSRNQAPQGIIGLVELEFDQIVRAARG